MSKLQDYLSQIDAKAGEVKGLFDAADAKGGDMTDDDKGRVMALNKEIEELEKHAAEAKQMDDLRSANDGRVQSLRQPIRSVPLPGGDSKAAQQRQAAKSLADQFLESEGWQSYFKGIAPAGQVSERTRVQSPPMQFNVGVKTLITGVSDTSAGAFVVADQSGIYDPLGRRPLMLRDLVSVRQTGSDLIEYVTQTSRVNAAAAVAEATATSGSSGVKPEGGFAFARVQTAVKTLAEWVAASKRSLSDAGQMRGIINDELRMDLEQLLDDQIINGDGTGENLAGLDAVSGTQDQAWDTNILTTTRKARTLVNTVGRAFPTAYALNPLDWQTIDLTQDNEARYYFGGPSQIGTPRLWGLPVVESEAVPVGWGWVGDWKRIVLWDREQFAISMSDSHSDFFIRNLVAVLGELRVALGVIRPSAFVEMDLTA